eukprot:SAG31_NODE_6890_length_1859_cov_3.975568_2_plen_105_part_00
MATESSGQSAPESDPARLSIGSDRAQETLGPYTGQSNAVSAAAAEQSAKGGGAGNGVGSDGISESALQRHLLIESSRSKVRGVTFSLLCDYSRNTGLKSREIRD